MSSGGRRVRWTLILLGLVALVYAPLRSAMPVGEDPRILARVAELDDALGAPGTESPGRPGPAALFSLAPDGVGPLGAASLVWTSRLWRGSGTWDEASLVVLRAENLALLLLAALALGLLVRRLLEPWSSAEHAHAAGVAATFLFALHPLAPSAVASPGARGDLLAGALLLWGGALFLDGRQRRRPRRVLMAGLLVLAAGLCSDLALLVAPLLALAEWTSARRSRRPGVRRRTALTTLVAFALLSASGPMLAAALGLDGGAPRVLRGLAMFDDWRDLLGSLALGLERFGLLLFPINARGTGLFDFVALGLLLMVVLHPALIAARAAPRLWSTVLASWFAGMLLVQLPAADLRVYPNDWTHARQLLAGAAVMAGGLAVAATAVSGRRRVVIPLLVVLGLGLLARADADCLNRAGRPARRLQADLVSGLERFAGARNLLVIDPPGLVRAHRAVGPELGWLVHPSLIGAAARPGTRVRGLGAEAFAELMRLPEGAARRAEGLIVDLPLAALGLPRPTAERMSVLLPPAAAPGGPTSWRDAGASPALSLDPLTHGCLIAVPPPERPTLLPPLVRWRSQGDPRLPAGLQGTWIVGEEGPYAVFDLDRSLAWLLAGEVELILLEGGVGEPSEARLQQDLPVLEGARQPQVRGEHWAFTLEAEALTPFDLDQSFVLSVLDLATLRRVELLAYLTGRGEILAEGVEPLLRRMRRAGGDLVWSLEHRAAGRAIARVRGRL